MRKAGKSIHRPEFAVVIQCLAEIREHAKLTQIELAARVRRTQTFISSAERGIRRVDIVQLRDLTHACGMDLEAFGRMVEERIAKLTITVPASKKPPRKKTTR